jgi:hypothetical protein
MSPIIFWTPREVPLLCAVGDSTAKNSAHGQKIALATIVDQTNNFATAQAAVLPTQSGSLLQPIFRPPSHPGRGVRSRRARKLCAFERVMWSSDYDLRSWKLTRKQFRRC